MDSAIPAARPCGVPAYCERVDIAQRQIDHVPATELVANDRRPGRGPALASRRPRNVDEVQDVSRALAPSYVRVSHEKGT
jgi:hypothetical protein